jgi:hypothetical protein
VFRSAQRQRKRHGYDHFMKHRSTSRTRSDARVARNPRPGRLQPGLARIGREIDAIYLQLDDQLTRMAQIQLRFDRLRSKVRLL